jgi:hypothetical protein
MDVLHDDDATILEVPPARPRSRSPDIKIMADGTRVRRAIGTKPPVPRAPAVEPKAVRRNQYRQGRLTAVKQFIEARANVLPRTKDAILERLVPVQEAIERVARNPGRDIPSFDGSLPEAFAPYARGKVEEVLERHGANYPGGHDALEAELLKSQGKAREAQWHFVDARDRIEAAIDDLDNAIHDACTAALEELDKVAQEYGPTAPEAHDSFELSDSE